MATCGEKLALLLEAWGIDTAFGIPGTHTIELYRGLPQTRIRHVTPRHEQGAGFMAVLVYHAWENYQFPGWKQNQNVVPSPWKPIHIAGGYGHLRYRMYYAAPSHGPRGTTVEVERV